MAAAVAFELMFFQLAAERIAVNAEDLRGAGLIAAGAIHDALDEFLLELGDCFFEQNAPIHHLGNQGFQLIFQNRSSDCFAAGSANRA
jgi:hypothetical protein